MSEERKAFPWGMSAGLIGLLLLLAPALIFIRTHKDEQGVVVGPFYDHVTRLVDGHSEDVFGADDAHGDPKAPSLNVLQTAVEKLIAKMQFDRWELVSVASPAPYTLLCFFRRERNPR